MAARGHGHRRFLWRVEVGVEGGQGGWLVHERVLCLQGGAFVYFQGFIRIRDQEPVLSVRANVSQAEAGGKGLQGKACMRRECHNHILPYAHRKNYFSLRALPSLFSLQAQYKKPTYVYTKRLAMIMVTFTYATGSCQACSQGPSALLAFISSSFTRAAEATSFLPNKDDIFLLLQEMRPI